MFDLEDMRGIVRCILWPDQYSEHGELVQADATLVVRGSVDRRPGSEESNLIVNELIPLDEAAQRFTRGMMVRVTEAQHSEQGLESLFEILRGYPGNCELQLVVCLADGSRAYLKSDRVRVELNAEMRSRVDALLGPGNVRLIAAPPTPAQRPPGGPAGLCPGLAARVSHAGAGSRSPQARFSAGNATGSSSALVALPSFPN